MNIKILNLFIIATQFILSTSHLNACPHTHIPLTLECERDTEDNTLIVRISGLQTIPDTHILAGKFMRNAAEDAEFIGFDWRKMRIEVELADEAALEEHHLYMLSKRILPSKRFSMLGNFVKRLIPRFSQLDGMKAFLNLVMRVEAQCVFLRDMMPGLAHVPHTSYGEISERRGQFIAGYEVAEADDEINRANNRHLGLTSLTEKLFGDVLPFNSGDAPTAVKFQKAFLEAARSLGYEKTTITNMLLQATANIPFDFAADQMAAMNAHMYELTERLQASVDDFYADVRQ